MALSSNYRGCGRKRAYTKKVALTVARRQRKQSGENIYAYQCSNCGDWHIGHNTDMERKMKDGGVE